MQQKLTKKRPKRPCVYFGQMQYQLARHLRRHHKNKKAVSELTRMKDDKDKNFVFSRVRKSENGRHGPKDREQKMHTQEIVTEDKKMHQTSDKEMYMEYTLLFGTTHIKLISKERKFTYEEQDEDKEIHRKVTQKVLFQLTTEETDKKTRKYM